MINALPTDDHFLDEHAPSWEIQPRKVGCKAKPQYQRIAETEKLK
jgi:hypothetical protein